MIETHGAVLLEEALDTDGKIDALVGAMADSRVVLARMDANLAAILGRLDGTDKGMDDHETRLRLLEQLPGPRADYETRLRALELQASSTPDHEARIRRIEMKVYLAAGLALAGGGTLGTLAGKFIGA